MNILPKFPTMPRQFKLDIFEATVTHVLYRGQTPTVAPGPYQDLPNYKLEFLGRGEFDSDFTVYLNLKAKEKGIHKRTFDRDHETMVTQLSEALNAKLEERVCRRNFHALALMTGHQPPDSVTFNPTYTVDRPVLILNNDVARISIFSKDVEGYAKFRGDLSGKVQGIVQWTGFQGFFEIEGLYTGLNTITNRDALVAEFQQTLEKTWEFLAVLNLNVLEMNQLTKMDNIKDICEEWATIPTDRGTQPYRLASSYLPEGKAEVWKNVTAEFAISYLFTEYPVNKLAVALQPFYRETTEQPIIDLDIAVDGTAYLYLNCGEHNRTATQPVKLVLPPFTSR